MHELRPPDDAGDDHDRNDQELETHTASVPAERNTPELHLFDGGHWLLETHFADAVARMREFLSRVMLS
jgi:surfactin synthase thioesterase subunit